MSDMDRLAGFSFPFSRQFPSAGCSRGNRCIGVAFLALLAIVALANAAFGETAKNVRSRTDRPLAIRGGVLMLPLTADRAGDHWPATLSISLADRQKIDGQVAWITAAPLNDTKTRRWTD